MNKLQACQSILRRNGLRPGAALATGTQSDMGLAETFLDEEELEVQSGKWHYNNRKDIELSPVLFTFDNAAWTEATKTLTQTGKFADATAGQTLEIASGAASPGSYTVATVVSDDAVTLEEDINDGGGNIASGIVGEATNNAILIPAYVISIDSDDVDVDEDFAQRGGRILDMENNTDLFTRSYKFTYKERVDFECIPYEIRRYIMLRAARLFAEHRETKQWPAIDRECEKARQKARDFDIRVKDRNFLRTTQARRAAGYRTSSRAFWSRRT